MTIDWVGHCNHLRDFTWKDIHNWCTVNASEFFEWVQDRIGVYIPHRKYQIKPPDQVLLP